jgi:hypothetical protein
MTPKKPFWKKARGDHMITAAIVTSLGLTITLAKTIFADVTGLPAIGWFLMSSLWGVYIPLLLAPTEWIDFEGKIPEHTFWKELLS